MMRFVREFRLIPVVLLATASLAALKLMGLLLDGGYLLTDADYENFDKPIHIERDIATGADTVTDNKISMTQAAPSWAQQVFSFPDVTGAVPEEKPAEHGAEKPAAKPPPTPMGRQEKPIDGKVIDLDAKAPTSPGERALLEHLQERRQ